MEKRLNLLYIAVIAVVFAVMFSTQFDPKLHISGDNAVYLTLARNLADGHGYTAMGTDGGYHPASHFPPGYSALLSFFMVLGIDSLVFFKILNGILLLASLLMVFVMVKGLTGRPVLAFCTVLLAVFSPQTLGFATIVMSEMAYMFCVTAGMFMLYLYSGRPSRDGRPSTSSAYSQSTTGPAPSHGRQNTVSSGRQTLGPAPTSGIQSASSPPPSGQSPSTRPYCFLRDVRFWGAVVLLVAAYYIRSVGMSALDAGLVFFLFRREWKQAGVFAGGVVLLLLPWSVRNAVHGIESRYFGTIMTVNPWRPEQGTISTFGEMFTKMVGNFDETVIKGFREIVFPFMELGEEPSGALSVISGLVVLGIVFYGAWRMGRMRWVFIFYLLGNIALFMLWHGGNGSRYVTPLAPLLFVFFYAGVYYLVLWTLSRLPSGGEKPEPVKGLPCTLPFLFLIMILPALKPLAVQAEMARYPYPPHYENYFLIARQLNRQAPRGSVVIARKPDLFNYFADRLVAVNYKFTTDPYELIADLVEKNADYVVLEQLGYNSTPLYLLPAVNTHPELFPVVWQLDEPETYLLFFDRRLAAMILAGEEIPEDYFNLPDR
ncbi:MAG: hypothetical protein LIO85_00295 [Rikenellaceae bacterium]|nr:hypothetical protein [Rikenellaceae bacterium]